MQVLSTDIIVYDEVSARSCKNDFHQAARGNFIADAVLVLGMVEVDLYGCLIWELLALS